MRTGALFLAVFGLALAAQPETVPAPLRLGDRVLSDRLVQYRIQALLSPERKEIAGRLQLTLRNQSRQPLQRACLHLYLNAFRDPNSVFFQGGKGRKRLRSFDPTRPGSIEVRELRQDGKLVPWHLILDGTVLEASLPQPVPVGASLRLELAFRSTLPRFFARSGFAGDFFMVAQWYPKPGVLREDGSWYCPPYYPLGEFFADFATYDVTLQVPSSFQVGASGVPIGERTLPGGLRELRFSAVDVHDFAWTAWPHFERHTRRVDGVELELLTVPGRRQAARELADAEQALARLQRWLRPYPYRKLTIVDVPTTSMTAGDLGMEYPTLFTTWTPWWAPNAVHVFDEITIHELVHQYFQGMVASNEIEEPWLDEGVTSYVTGLLLDEMLGPDRSVVALGPFALGQQQQQQLQIAGRTTTEAAPVGWPAWRFDSFWEYNRTVYARAALLLRTIESILGRPAMRAALADYVRLYSFRHPTSADLERTLLARTRPNQRPTIARVLDGVLRRAYDLDYAVACDAEAVRVRRHGALAVPLQLEVWTKQGKQDIPIAGDAVEERIPIAGLLRARLGPPGRLALDHTPADNACELSPIPGRAALGWATAVQPLLQVLGP